MRYAASKKYQFARWVLTSLLIVLFVTPRAIDRQLSRVILLNIYDSHVGATGFAADRITDLDVVFIRHRFSSSLHR